MDTIEGPRAPAVKLTARHSSLTRVTQQPKRQFTSGFVCVKALETSFVINKISCQNSKFQNFAEHLNF